MCCVFVRQGLSFKITVVKDKGSEFVGLLVIIVCCYYVSDSASKYTRSLLFFYSAEEIATQESKQIFFHCLYMVYEYQCYPHYH